MTVRDLVLKLTDLTPDSTVELAIPVMQDGQFVSWQYAPIHEVVATAKRGEQVVMLRAKDKL